MMMGKRYQCGGKKWREGLTVEKRGKGATKTEKGAGTRARKDWRTDRRKQWCNREWTVRSRSTSIPWWWHPFQLLGDARASWGGKRSGANRESVPVKPEWTVIGSFWMSAPRVACNSPAACSNPHSPSPCCCHHCALPKPTLSGLRKGCNSIHTVGAQSTISNAQSQSLCARSMMLPAYVHTAISQAFQGPPPSLSCPHWWKPSA